jgi:hypothetical protein
LGNVSTAISNPGGQGWQTLFPTSILRQAEIAQELTGMGTPVSQPTVKQILDDHGFAKRQIEKTIPGGSVPDRNQQFEHIEELKKRYFDEKNPVFSIDTKKKELLGTLYRKGRSYCQESFQAFDHDFPSWSSGKIVPHGIWDPIRNHGHLNLGISSETSQFACDSFRWYWQRIGRHHYPEATSMLWLCDAGGSNNCRHYIFKQDLQELANELEIDIRVAHYPTYCSKFNPIERRFFSQVTRACEGVLFDCLDTVVRLMRKTATQTGLSTTVHVIKKLYQTKRKATNAFREHLPIRLDPILPRWNYTAIAGAAY